MTFFRCDKKADEKRMSLPLTDDSFKFQACLAPRLPRSGAASWGKESDRAPSWTPVPWPMQWEWGRCPTTGLIPIPTAAQPPSLRDLRHRRTLTDSTCPIPAIPTLPTDSPPTHSRPTSSSLSLQTFLYWKKIWSWCFFILWVLKTHSWWYFFPRAGKEPRCSRVGKSVYLLCQSTFV